MTDTHANTVLANKLPQIIEQLKLRARRLDSAKSSFILKLHVDPYSYSNNNVRANKIRHEIIPVLEKMANGAPITIDEHEEVTANKYIHEQGLKLHQAIQNYDNIIDHQQSPKP